MTLEEKVAKEIDVEAVDEWDNLPDFANMATPRNHEISKRYWRAIAKARSILSLPEISSALEQGEGLSRDLAPDTSAPSRAVAPRVTEGGERITYGSDGLLDEVAAGGAYLERMSGKGFFLTMERYDGSEVAVWLTSKTKLNTMVEERSPRPRHLRSLSPTARPAQHAAASPQPTGHCTGGPTGVSDEGPGIGYKALYLAALEQGEAVREGEGWQPIDSAPRDASYVLLWLGSVYREAVIRRWDWRIERWVDRDETVETGPLLPTHWMPLPAPPEGEGN